MIARYLGCKWGPVNGHKYEVGTLWHLYRQTMVKAACLYIVVQIQMAIHSGLREKREKREKEREKERVKH